MQKSPHTWLKKIESKFNQDANLLVISETSKDFALEFIADTNPSEALFADEDMEDFTPHVFIIEHNQPGRKLLSELLESGAGKNALFFAQSRLTGAEFIKQMRRYQKVCNQEGDIFWLRFWDPRVTGGFITGLNHDEYQEFFNRIDWIMVEDYKNPQELLYFEVSGQPEAMDKDKPAAWDDKGRMLIRPELEHSLERFHLEYLEFALAEKLNDEYPRQELNAHDWIQEQYHYCLSKLGLVDDDDSVISENFITAAWLAGCDVAKLNQHLELPAQDNIGAYTLSEKTLEQARIYKENNVQNQP